MRYLRAAGKMLLYLLPPYWLYLAWQWAFPPPAAKVRRTMRNLGKFLGPSAELLEQQAAVFAQWGEVAREHSEANLGDSEALALLGTGSEFNELASVCRERAEAMRAFAHRLAQHTLEEDADYVGDTAFQQDMKTAQAVLTVVLFGLGTWSIPLRLLIAFPVARGFGWVAALGSQQVRRWLVRTKLRKLLRTVNTVQEALFT